MKKIKSHRITSFFLEGTIDECIEFLENEKQYYSEKYTNLRVQCMYDYGSHEAYYKYYIYGDKLETDEEEALRIEQEEEYRKTQEERDRRNYEELKAKFEKN